MSFAVALYCRFLWETHPSSYGCFSFSSFIVIHRSFTVSPLRRLSVALGVFMRELKTHRPPHISWSLWCFQVNDQLCHGGNTHMFSVYVLRIVATIISGGNCIKSLICAVYVYTDMFHSTRKTLYGNTSRCKMASHLYFGERITKTKWLSLSTYLYIRSWC